MGIIQTEANRTSNDPEMRGLRRSTKPLVKELSDKSRRAQNRREIEEGLEDLTAEQIEREYWEGLLHDVFMEEYEDWDNPGYGNRIFC